MPDKKHDESPAVRIARPIRLMHAALLAVFFFSAVSASVYWIIPIKMPGQVLGLTIFAISTLLAAFMTA